MSVGWPDYIAIIGVLFTAIAAVPVFKEIYPAGNGHDKKTVSFAQEVLTGSCDEDQQNYWTSVRNHALEQIEARQAFPETRKTFGFMTILTGMGAFVLAGGLTHPAAFNRWAAIMAIFISAIGLGLIVLGAYLIRTVEKARSKIMSGRVKQTLTAPPWMRLAALASLSYFIGAIWRARGMAIDPGTHYSNVYSISAIISFLAGLIFIILSIVLSPSLFDDSTRSDQHLLAPMSNPKVVPLNNKSNPPVRRNLLSLLVVDMLIASLWALIGGFLGEAKRALPRNEIESSLVGINNSSISEQ